jgi:hypothetical protein
VVGISTLTEFFELSLDTIRLICTKLLTNKQSNDKAKLLFDSLPLSEINMDDNAQHDFILETLLQFDQILKITTIELWQAYTYKVKQLNAANNLKAKMTPLQVIEASAATAEAIARATSLVDENHEQDLQTKLRLSNLEKILKRN